jgi:predicted phosphodiesterase
MNKYGGDSHDLEIHVRTRLNRMIVSISVLIVAGLFAFLAARSLRAGAAGASLPTTVELQVKHTASLESAPDEIPSATPTASASPAPTKTPPPATPTATPTATATATTLRTPTLAVQRVRWEPVDFGPYLQMLTPHSVEILWHTIGKTRGGIEYGLPGQQPRVMEALARSYSHTFRLNDLQPGTTYTYRVLRDGRPLSDRFRFETPHEGADAPLRFVVYGDTQHDPEIHAEIVQRARTLDPELVVHVGDLVNVGSAVDKWRGFFEAEGILLAETPLYPTLGNHEGVSELYFVYFSLPGNERWYTFTHGPARFISLQVDGFSDFSSGSPQQRWLERTLASNQSPWTFVFFHKPPYSAAYEGEEEAAMRRALTPLFEAYGVDVVFSGHNHNYQRSFVNGVFYIVSGGGGGYLSDDIDNQPHLIVAHVKYHLLLIEIEGDEFRLSAIRPDGRRFDTFTITRQ